MDLSVVIPVFGCADCLRTLHRRVTDALTGRSFELVLIDDASRDRAWPILKDLATGDPRVTAIRLSRNVGQQTAISAGLAASRGRWVVVMDCDLEDPPEWITRLLARAEQGFDIVLTRYHHRRQPCWRKAASRLYFALVRRRTGSALLQRPGMFSVLSRRAVAAYQASPGAGHLYLQTLVRLPLPIDIVDYPRQPRYAGRSAYDLRRLVKLFLRGVGWRRNPPPGIAYHISEVVRDGAVH